MSAKEVRFSVDARDRMLHGIDTLAHAVRVTLGPKGRNVLLDKSFGAPRMTKDGVTVAKEIELENKFENMGAQMVREVASKTSDQAGDGTTTATVLAHAIVREGAKAVAAGMNPMDLKRGVDLAVEAVVVDLQKNSKNVTSNEEIAQVGTISANGDADIGRFLADAMKKVGNEGVITVEEAKSLETELEVVEGMQFDRGYVSPYFVTNAEKMRVEMEDPYILIYEKKLSACRNWLRITFGDLGFRPTSSCSEIEKAWSLATICFRFARELGCQVRSCLDRIKLPARADSLGRGTASRFASHCVALALSQVWRPLPDSHCSASSTLWKPGMCSCIPPG